MPQPGPTERRAAASARGEGASPRLADAFAGAGLSEGQVRLVEELADFLAQPDQRLFVLKGYAGTGKTFMVKGLAAWLHAEERAFCLAAPTGRAAKIIAAKTGFEATTLHRLIYDFERLVEFSDGEGGDPDSYRSYFAIADTDLPDDGIIIVDEASLLSNVESESEFFRSGTGFLLDDLMTFAGFGAGGRRRKILFIGDPAQLTPVNMARAPALDEAYLRERFAVEPRGFLLTDVMRQRAGSGLMANIVPLRDALQANRFSRIGFDFTAPDVAKMALEEVTERYLEACDHAVSDRAMIVCSSNAECGALNRAVRARLFPGQAEVARGDKLMVVANTHIDGHFIPNGEFVQVRAVAPQPEIRRLRTSNARDARELEFRFRTLRLGVRDGEGRSHFFDALVLESLLYGDAPLPSVDEQKALYRDFCIRHDRRALGDLWKEAMRRDPYLNALRVKFGYAMTCHKAQGGEWESVLVSCPDRMPALSAEMFRWLYTAMTRARTRLFLCNPPAREMGEGMTSGSPPPRPGQGVASRDPGSGTPPPVPRARPLDDDAVRGASAHGLGPGDGILYQAFLKTRRLLEGTGIALVDIGHNQYQEAYYFRRDTTSARINLAYNGKGRIAGLHPAARDPLSLELVALLEPLKAMVGAPAAPEEGGAPASLSKPFLTEFDARLRARAEARGIAVRQVEERAWTLRYTFARADEVGVFDIHYNGSGQFRRFAAVRSYCAGEALLAELDDMLANGLGA